jgi:hypothetical protein
VITDSLSHLDALGRCFRGRRPKNLKSNCRTFRDGTV